MSTYSREEIRGSLELVERYPSEQLESETIEFKEFRDAELLLAACKDLADDISALANHNGGVIVIGVKDSKHVTGDDWPTQLVGAPDIDQVQLKERLVSRLQPRIDLDVFSIEFRKTNFLVVQVPQRSDTIVGTTAGRYSIRIGRASQPMTPSEITQRITSQTSYDWSGQIVDGPTIRDLDESILKAAIDDYRLRRSLPSLPSAGAFLESIEATRNGKLTKAGLVFLGTESAIRNYIGDIEYRFSWSTPNGKLYVNDVWRGNLWAARIRANGHFDRSNSSEYFEHKGKRYQYPRLDGSAFHEAFTNALVHRDYSAEGMIAIDFTGDQMTITSPGAFYGGVTETNIGLHEPRHRNKALARLLTQYGLVDRAGMGVARMNLTSLKYGRQAPTFAQDLGNVRVTMQAQVVREPVFLLASAHESEWGVPELLIVNAVCTQGCVSIFELAEQLRRVVTDPWEALDKAVSRVPGIEQCCTKDNVVVAPHSDWIEYYQLEAKPRTEGVANHIQLYRYLCRHRVGTAAELARVLGVRTSQQAARILRVAPYVRRVPRNGASVWELA